MALGAVGPQVIVEYLADTTKLKAASSQAAGASSKAGRGIKAGFVPAVAALATLGVAAGKAANDASDLQETINKSKVVFGDAAGAVEAWSTTTADAFGIAQTDALAAAATFGDMFAQLGLGQKDASKASRRMVELAGDLGSFHNVDPSDVLERVSAAFRGEYDSIQKLVPNINAARVEQEALRQTGKKSKKDLTALDKALAVQAILMKDTKDAQGDAAKTADTYAGRQRRLAANTKDFSAQMGKSLLPVMEAFMGVAQKVGDWAQKHPTLFKALAIAIAAVAAAIVIMNIGLAIAAIITAPLSLTVLAVVAGIIALIAVGVLLYKNWDRIKQVAGKVWEGIKKAVGRFIDWLKANWDLILPILFGPFGLAVLLIKRNWGKIKSVVSAGVDAVRTVLGKLRDIFSKPGEWVRTAVAKVKDAFTGLVSWLRGLPGKIRSAISGAADALKGPLNAIIGAWNSLRLPSFSLTIPVPGPLPDVKFRFGGYGLPDIPKLAEGGIITRPTVALLGEAGPEAVLPLGGGGLEVRVYIGDTELKGIVRTEIGSTNSATARMLMAGSS